LCTDVERDELLKKLLENFLALAEIDMTRHGSRVVKALFELTDKEVKRG